MNLIKKTLGWLGSLLLAVCALPELIVTIQNGHCVISWGMLLSWGFGELFILVYIYEKKDIPLILNYSINCLIIFIMMGYKL